jgi:hypothetical protein
MGCEPAEGEQANRAEHGGEFLLETKPSLMFVAARFGGPRISESFRSGPTADTRIILHMYKVPGRDKFNAGPNQRRFLGTPLDSRRYYRIIGFMLSSAQNRRSTLHH